MFPLSPSQGNIPGSPPRSKRTVCSSDEITSAGSAASLASGEGESISWIFPALDALGNSCVAPPLCCLMRLHNSRIADAKFRWEDDPGTTEKLLDDVRLRDDSRDLTSGGRSRDLSRRLCPLK